MFCTLVQVTHTCEIRYIYQKVSQYLKRPPLKLDVIGQLAQQDQKRYQDSPSFQQGFIRLPCDQCFFREHFFLILFLISSKSSLGLCKNLHEIFAHVPKVSAVFGRAPRAAIFRVKVHQRRCSQKSTDQPMKT